MRGHRTSARRRRPRTSRTFSNSAKFSTGPTPRLVPTRAQKRAAYTKWRARSTIRFTTRWVACSPPPPAPRAPSRTATATSTRTITARAHSTRWCSIWITTTTRASSPQRAALRRVSNWPSPSCIPHGGFPASTTERNRTSTVARIRPTARTCSTAPSSRVPRSATTST